MVKKKATIREIYKLTKITSKKIARKVYDVRLYEKENKENSMWEKYSSIEFSSKKKALLFKEATERRWQRKNQKRK